MAQIAITTCSRLEDYKQAIIHSGGEVRVVDASMGVDQALEGADGLMLTGGDDVAPTRYGEDAHESTVRVAPERDEFEIALVREARRRGLQVLNVAEGGSLFQDIPSQIPGALEHKQAVPPKQSYDFAHEIWLEKD